MAAWHYFPACAWKKGLGMSEWEEESNRLVQYPLPSPPPVAWGKGRAGRGIHSTFIQLSLSSRAYTCSTPR